MGNDKSDKKEQKFIAEAFLRVLEEDTVTPSNSDSISNELKRILDNE